MREAIRVAMLDAGRFNVDAMWGPPWNPAWLRNDPFVFAPRLQGLSMFISAASGLPGEFDHPRAPIDYYNTANGMGLEARPGQHPRLPGASGHPRCAGHLRLPRQWHALVAVLGLGVVQGARPDPGHTGRLVI